ncbi:MAG: hypothetical protein FWG66_02190 [Spirochaetes bacterium]|nr:hypothetical protein [Spirochaetota bacterium]
MIKVKAFCFILVFSLCAAGAWAQTQVVPWWYSLARGQNLFRNGDYGQALMSFEDARRNRWAMFDQMERDFIDFLSLPEVRILGDALDWVEIHANTHHHPAVRVALSELFFRVPRESLGNSATMALQAIGGLREYPEAEFWIGEVFRVGGEFGLALAQYRRAYERRDLFQNRHFQIDLLYRMAEVLQLRQEYPEMEQVLLSIVYATDTLWSDAAAAGYAPISVTIGQLQAEASFAVQAMTRMLEESGPNSFLAFFRHVSPQSEEAHRRLGFFYAERGRVAALHHLMFAFLIQNSTILEELIRRQFDFTFTNLTDLAQEINRLPMLAAYAEERQYFQTAFFLADSLFRNGWLQPAMEIWAFLAATDQAGEWQLRAISQLQNPTLEPVILE